MENPNRSQSKFQRLTIFRKIYYVNTIPPVNCSDLEISHLEEAGLAVVCVLMRRDTIPSYTENNGICLTKNVDKLFLFDTETHMVGILAIPTM